VWLNRVRQGWGKHLMSGDARMRLLPVVPKARLQRDGPLKRSLRVANTATWYQLDIQLLAREVTRQTPPPSYWAISDNGTAGIPPAARPHRDHMSNRFAVPHCQLRKTRASCFTRVKTRYLFHERAGLWRCTLPFVDLQSAIGDLKHRSLDAVPVGS